MATLTENDIEDLARKYGVSSDAVSTLLRAVNAGHGTMAQFNHPELGGFGQWSCGGMTMIGDMFNDALKAKVAGLCSDLANLLNQQSSKPLPSASTGYERSSQTSERGHDDVSLFIPDESHDAWWGEDLGPASATGSQNNVRYAYFSASRRLAIKIGDEVSLYDTGDHEIGGVSQQQSSDSSLTFTSQRGLVRVAELHRVR